MLAVFDDFVKSLHVPDLIQSYLNASPDFETLQKWLQDELSSVASNFLEEGQLEAFKHDREKLYQQLDNTWIIPGVQPLLLRQISTAPRRIFEYPLYFKERVEKNPGYWQNNVAK